MIKLLLLCSFSLNVFSSSDDIIPDMPMAAVTSREPFARVFDERDSPDEKEIGARTLKQTSHSGDGFTPSVIKEARRAGLSRHNLENIRDSLADEYNTSIEEMITTRRSRASCAKVNEFIGTVAGFGAIISSPLAGATLLVSPDATPFIIYIGSIFAIIKIFHISMAKYCASQAKEAQAKLDSMTNNIGMQSVNMTPNVISPEFHNTN